MYLFIFYWAQSLGWEDLLEKGMEIHSSILAWKSHGQRSLVGYSLWGRKESDTTSLPFPSLHLYLRVQVGSNSIELMKALALESRELDSNLCCCCCY